MEHKVIFSGFGGQGVISMGNLIAYSAMAEDKEVTVYPSYGIAMRGGSASCSVIISDEKIASPVIADPTTFVAMNKPSFDLFLDKQITGENVIANSSLIDKTPLSNGVKIFYAPVNDIAKNLGNVKVANMAMIGALLKVTEMLSIETVYKTIEKTFPAKHLKYLDLNKECIQQGYNAI